MDTTDHDPTPAEGVGGADEAAGSPAVDGSRATTAPGAAPHSYDYGSADAPDGSDAPGASDAPAVGSPTVGSPADAETPAPTSPRAVLRPVPEGFPAPAVAPLRSHRAPALPVADEPASRSGRGLRIAAIAVAAVLLLAVLTGGGILAVRALTGGGEDAATASSDPAASAAATGTVALGPATFREVSTEVGVRSVGDTADRLEPEGEFVIVTVEITNDGEAPLLVSSGGGTMELVSAAGDRYPVSEEANLALVADSEAFGTVGTGETAVYHGVFDVPAGTEPTGLDLAFSSAPEVGRGTLPLGG